LSAVVTAACLSIEAKADVVPGAPKLAMSYNIENGVGKVSGTLTAPSKDSQWGDLPADTKIDIVVKRSCSALSQSGVQVYSVNGLAPGESVTFTDDAEPAWQCDYDFTYYTYPSVAGVAGTTGYGSCSPGVKFSFGYTDLSATPSQQGNQYSVELSAVVPSKTSSYPQTDLTIDMKALEFYRIIDMSSYPMETELIRSIPNPEKGKTYKCTDDKPTINAQNYYLVKCVSDFGSTESTTQTYVGQDVPLAPVGVKAEPVEGGYKITWSAPDGGVNGGMINPDDTYYIVYRSWGNNASEREKITDEVKGLEYTDYGADLDAPKAVRYIVQSANSVGLGNEQFSGYDYNLLVGPSYRLPFVETFDGGLTKVWSVVNSSYYSQLYVGAEAEFGSDNSKVAPHSGTGLIYADYTNNRGNSTNDLTSYAIDVTSADVKAVSYWYYALPGTDISIDLQMSTDGGEFVSLDKVQISKDKEGNAVTAEGWKRVIKPLTFADGVKNVALRLHFSAPTSKLAAIVDDFMLLDYPSVGELKVTYRPEDLEAVITWEDPSSEYAKVTGYVGYVNGESVGAVTSPWTYKATYYLTPVTVAVCAIYDDTEAAMSAGHQVSVPRPAYTEFTIGDHVFAVVQGTAPEVHEVTVKQYTGTDIIYRVPERVTYDEKSFLVIGIDAGAYKGNKTLASVTVPEGNATIGDEAFMDCSSIMAISLGEDVQHIGAGAFKGCSSLATAIFLSIVPPETADDAFEGVSAGCKGECPADSKDYYEAVKGLDPIDFGGSGVDFIIGEDDAEVHYYDLNGYRVSEPRRGETVIVVTPRGAAKRIVR